MSETPAPPTRPPLRRLARALRHTPDRLLHPLRRRRLAERLRERGVPASILFVCYGNICRSPYAEHALPRFLTPGIRALLRIDSAGFVGPGRPSPPAAVAVAGRRGVDLAAHRSRPLTAERIHRADLVVVMDSAQRLWLSERLGTPARFALVLGDLDPGPIDTRAIRDPIQQPEEVFEEVYDRIDRCLAALATELAAAADAAREGADVGFTAEDAEGAEGVAIEDRSRG